MNPTQANRWRTLRRCLTGFAVCVTLIGLFYTEENWRGERAWENTKRALEDQGIDFKWADYIPAPGPENENFFGVPEMQSWFNGRGQTELSRKLSYPGFSNYSFTERMVVADVTICLPGKPAPDGSIALRWDDPASRTEAGKLLTNSLGPTAAAPQSPFGVGFMLRRSEEIQPARIFLQCQTAPTEQDLQQFLPYSVSQGSSLKFEPDGAGSYRATVPQLVTAADYLAWSEQFEAQFTLIRQALQRPYARMQGNYDEPVYLPIPNFPSVRALGQTLGAQAECDFLLGRPEDALRALTLMHESCRPILEENKPMTLVAAMINVALRGLYAATIADGIRLQAWQEPQLAMLEDQLKTINVLVPVRQAFAKEPVSVCRTVETTSSARLLELFMEGRPGAKSNSWTELRRSALGELLPHGWLYQNMVTCISFLDAGAEVDSASQIVYPEKVEAVNRKVRALSNWSPYTFLAAVTTANHGRAWQTAAHSQTEVNQALIACALERYRLAHREYPENLEAMVPQYLSEIPHDVIGGQPPHYRRAADGTYVLYSIGWSGRDGGGVPGKSIAEGDWVY